MTRVYTPRQPKPLDNRLAIYFQYVLLTLAIVTIATTAHLANIDWEKLMFGEVEHVRLEGDYRHIDRFEIEQLLSPFIGHHLSKSDLHALEYSLRAMPWIRKVVIQRVWSDTLVIHLQEREPIAYWGKNALLDANGELFVPHLVGSDNLPVFVAGPGREKYMLAFYRLLQHHLFPLGLKIDAVEEKQSRAYIVKLANTPHLYLGRDHLQERLERFVVAYQGGFDQHIDKVACIDLRYPNGFAVRWRNQTGDILC